VLSSTAHPAEAKTLASFLAGKPGQTDLCRIGVIQPADRDLAASSLFLDGKTPRNKALLLTAADRTVFQPGLAAWRRFAEDLLAPALARAWSGQGDVDQLVREAVDRANHGSVK
jgi:ABC-type glycerol-3-phosphate transport system substrate-binding protein